MKLEALVSVELCDLKDHTCSGDSCRGGRAQVADLKKEFHCGVKGNPLIARQSQHLETTGGTR